MSKYLIHFNGKGRVAEIDNRATSSDDWGVILEGFAKESLNGRKPDDPRFVCAEAIHLYDDQTTPQGIPYDWELCGPGGGSYRLLVFLGQDSEAVRMSKEWLRRQFDVVHLHVLRVDLVAPAVTSERVFSGVFPCGIGYADRKNEENGDYKKLAFLCFSTLELETFTKDASLLAYIKADVKRLNFRKGQQFQVSTCGQTVILGTAIKEG